MLGLAAKDIEGSLEEPTYSDVPRRLDQLIGWLVDAGRRAETIVETVARLRDTIN